APPRARSIPTWSTTCSRAKSPPPRRRPPPLPPTPPAPADRIPKARPPYVHADHPRRRAPRARPPRRPRPQAVVHRPLVLLHEPQGHRHAVPAVLLRDVHHRRGDERDDPPGADGAGPAARQPALLQPDDHGARAGHDLRRRHAGL